MAPQHILHLFLQIIVLDIAPRLLQRRNPVERAQHELHERLLAFRALDHHIVDGRQELVPLQLDEILVHVSSKLADSVLIEGTVTCHLALPQLLVRCDCTEVDAVSEITFRSTRKTCLFLTRPGPLHYH